MLIASMNQQASPDVLVVILAPNVAEQSVETNQNIARIYDPNTDTTLGFNFIGVSHIDKSIAGNGPIELSDDQINALKAAVEQAGFDATVLVADRTPKFVVGYVESTTKHPDSDHLLVT